MEASLTTESSFEWIINYFNLDLAQEGDTFYGCCPVHGGDNEGAFQVWPFQDKPYWQCRTHRCHEKYRSSLVGLIRGLLSFQNNRDMFGFGDTIKFIKSNVNIVDVVTTKNRAARENRLIQLAHEKVGKVDRPFIRRLAQQKNNEPTYFINRGWSRDILKQFDVFTCLDSKKPLYNRCIVPIYCKEEKVLGYTGRSILDECDKCGLFHKGDCPKTVDDKKRACKWYNIVDRSTALYNYWDVEAGKTLFVAEGPGDVWRLAEHGLNAVGLLGASPSAWQAHALARLSPTLLVVVTDADEAGERGWEAIRSDLSRYTRVVRMVPDAHDVADATDEYFDKLRSLV